MTRSKIPVGVSDFEKIRQNGYYYVDKSPLISALLNSESTEVTLITRPRRFGKTMAMSMLASFFDIRKNNGPLFEGLSISRQTELCQNWMNQWPTVFFTFKDVDGLSFRDAYDMLAALTAFLFQQYDFLLVSERVTEYDSISPNCISGSFFDGNQNQPSSFDQNASHPLWKTGYPADGRV